MEKRLATINDFDAIKKLYSDIIDHQKYDEYSPDWHKDIYPCDQDYITHINNNEFYIGIIDENIVTAAVLTDGDDPIYQKVNWKYKYEENNITVLHLFAVAVEQRRKGISKEMLDYLFEVAREKGKQVIHLDIAYGNLPAEKLYLKMGFEYTDTVDVYYQDTGDMKAVVMEKLL